MFVGNFYVHIQSEGDRLAIHGGRQSLVEAEQIFDKLNRIMNPNQYKYIGES